MGRLKGVMDSVFGGGSKNGKKGKGASSKKSKEPAYQPGKTVDSTDVLHQDEGLEGLEGTVFVLSLVEFYDAIGGRNGRIAEGLPIMCETVFEDQIANQGTFVRVGDDQFVFKFRGLDERQSLLKSAKIIEIIGCKLLGENFLKSGKFKALLTAMGMDDITDGDGNLDKDKVDHAVGLARAVPPEPTAPEDPVWVSLSYVGLDDDDRWAAVAGSEKDDIQWVSLTVEKKKTDVQWTTLERGEKKEDSTSQWTTLERGEKKQDSTDQWTTLEHKKDKNEAQWEFSEHKKKDNGFDWQALEAKKQSERQKKLMEEGVKRFRERRAKESDRRARRSVQLGQAERREQNGRRVEDRRVS
ncbi:MAG: hypothetical protein ISR44_04265 [Rhodospirillales bacterium]|nr:hypothetical protein [Rhodospirillales bacterium]